MPFNRVMGLTVLSALIPGTGYLATGRRKLGFAVLAILLLILAFGAYVALFGRDWAIGLAVEPTSLMIAATIMVMVGVAWVVVIVTSHRALRPRAVSPLQRILGSALVGVLALAVMSPMALGSRYAFVQRDVVRTIFAGDDTKSATRPQNVTAKDPWGGRSRVNLLLLGGDAGEGRDGTRTDSVIVASIDTRTGNTVLFSLPRNLTKLPFPKDSPLYDLYPDGVFQGEGPDAEWLLNAVYRNVPGAHPDALDSDHKGADALKLGVGEALGLKLDYFVLINLDGFEQLVDALGGVTVNINTRVPIGGNTDTGRAPDSWLEPGPNKHLDGDNALWFARGRYGSSDYARMGRQRCVINAIIQQADPATMLTRYEAIAKSSKDIVETDLPQTLLKPFVNLALNVKDANVTSIVFDNKVIRPSHPDYDLMRSKVESALAASEASPTPGASATAKAPGSSASPNAPDPTKPAQPPADGGDEESPDDEPSTGSSGSGSGSGSDTGSDKPADSLTDSCAYQPQS